jgi:hypothetical protein
LPAATARTPIDDVLDLLAAPSAEPAPAGSSGPSAADRVGGGAGAVARFLGDAARALVGAS